MSASETNLDQQKRRHWGPLAGIALALGVAVVAGVFFIGAPPVADDAADPDGTPVAVEQMSDEMLATEQNINVDRAEDAARVAQAEN